MRLPRFRIRTLMIAAAAVGMAAYVGTLLVRASEFRKVANLHGAKVQEALDANFPRLRDPKPHWTPFRRGSTPTAYTAEETAVVRNWEQRNRVQMNYHALLTWKYDRAARRPWLPVPPDPPEPQCAMSCPSTE